MIPRPSGRTAALLVTVALVVGGCTRGPQRPEEPADDRGQPGGTPSNELVLPVVASVRGPTADSDRTYLDGIRLGVRRVNRDGGVGGRPLAIRLVDDRGADARALIAAELRRDAPAVLVVGDAEPVDALRRRIEARRTPVVLLGGDLYSARQLFRYAFQTSPPMQWQAGVLARYLVDDRGHRRILVVHPPGDEPAYDALSASLAEEGAGEPDRLVSRGSPGRVVRAAGGADAVVLALPPPAAGRLAGEIAELDPAPQPVLTASALDRAAGSPPPGTVAVGSYAWAGWAEPLQRVARFRDHLERAVGHLPFGAEQQGYDAIRVLASALEAARGRSGEALVRALERVKRVTLSEVPITLGPDDHLFADRHLLGLFAVAGPGEAVEPWAPTWAPWRPLMRTFTLLGRRTSVLDGDKRAFFPGWRRREPAPFYWQAGFGITTRPEDDPLH